MKKLLMAVMAFVFIVGNMMAQDRQIEFSHDKYKKLLRKAKKQDKLIFFDAYTSWCGPCKMMARDVFTQNKVADFFNENFICTKMDMEKGEGPDLKKPLEITAFPTFMFINGDGKVVHRIVGAYDAETFITFSKLALTEDRNALALQQRYDKGERDGQFMFEYLRSLRLANLDKKEAEIAASYLASLKKEDLLKKENWNVVQNFMNDPGTAEFRYMVKNHQTLAGNVGTEAAYAKLYKAYSKALQQLGFYYPGSKRPFNQAQEDAIIEDLRNIVFPKSGELLVKVLKNKYKRLNDWTNYVAVMDGMVQFNMVKDHVVAANLANDAASMFEGNMKETGMLKKALAWASYAVSNEERVEHRSGYLATQAKLFTKLGDASKAEQAMSASEKADKEAEAKGTKIISVPAFKMTPMQPKKKKK